MSESRDSGFKGTTGSFIFLSRWLQAPLYFGLIVAQGIQLWQVVIHVTFVASALILAWIDRLTFRLARRPNIDGGVWALVGVNAV